MKALEGVNLAVRFLCELTAIGVTAYWGYRTGEGAMRWVLALAAPAAVIAVWALFVSPNPTIELARPLRFVIELAVWGGATAAFLATGHRTLATVFGVAAVGSGVLNYLQVR